MEAVMFLQNIGNHLPDYTVYNLVTLKATMKETSLLCNQSSAGSEMKVPT
jgi:hypothetical protein